MSLTIEHLKAQGLILFEAISGSRAYGLATNTSDTDIKGVFYLPKSHFFGLHNNYVAQVSNPSNDIVYYELGRFIELLLQNNPNMMELLATPADMVRYRHPLMRHIQPEWFISKLCEKTFSGFAQSQIKKARGLNKKIVNPMSKTKKSVLDFCTVFVDGKSIALTQWLTTQGINQRQIGLAAMPHTTQMYALYVDDKSTDSPNDPAVHNAEGLGFQGIIQKPTANQVLLSSIPKGMTPTTYLSFNQMGYSKYCKDYSEYWHWVDTRNEARYQATLSHGKQYDAKNMMHTFRLLQMALDIARTGQIIVTRPNRDALLAIKNGESEYAELLTAADQLEEDITAAFLKSPLPDLPNTQAALNALVSIRNELYRHSI